MFGEAVYGLLPRSCNAVGLSFGPSCTPNVNCFVIKPSVFGELQLCQLSIAEIQNGPQCHLSWQLGVSDVKCRAAIQQSS